MKGDDAYFEVLDAGTKNPMISTLPLRSMHRGSCSKKEITGNGLSLHLTKIPSREINRKKCYEKKLKPERIERKDIGLISEVKKMKSFQRRPFLLQTMMSHSFRPSKPSTRTPLKVSRICVLKGFPTSFFLFFVYLFISCYLLQDLLFILQVERPIVSFFSKCINIDNKIQSVVPFSTVTTPLSSLSPPVSHGNSKSIKYKLSYKNLSLWTSQIQWPSLDFQSSFFFVAGQTDDDATQTDDDAADDDLLQGVGNIFGGKEKIPVYPQDSLKCSSTFTQPTNQLICPESRNNYCAKHVLVGMAKAGCKQMHGYSFDEKNGLCIYRKCAHTCKDQSVAIVEFAASAFERREYCCSTDYCNPGASLHNFLPPAVLYIFSTILLTLLFTLDAFRV